MSFNQDVVTNNKTTSELNVISKRCEYKYSLVSCDKVYYNLKPLFKSQKISLKELLNVLALKYSKQNAAMQNEGLICEWSATFLVLKKHTVSYTFFAAFWRLEPSNDSMFLVHFGSLSSQLVSHFAWQFFWPSAGLWLVCMKHTFVVSSGTIASCTKSHSHPPKWWLINLKFILPTVTFIFTWLALFTMNVRTQNHWPLLKIKFWLSSDKF
jgi:hypothetical protein